MSRPLFARIRPAGWHRNACAWALRTWLRACPCAVAVLAATASAEDPEREAVGPLSISSAGRARVRGDRPERASIHAAWTPPAHDPDREDRDALAQFERANLSTTIVEVAPEPWMKQLVKPDLTVRWNRGTVEYLRYFKDDPRGKAMMRAWLRRAGRYQARMQAILREHGVPEDLVWVVLAESGFNPRVRSAVGAAGPWQFMDGTAGVYGLAKDHWIDERFDVERSTHAAAAYLADLETRFGSWELALAAYNAGYGLVMTAIERHNTNNFWALVEIESGLPHATVNYVPKILATALVARNREVFDVGPDDIQALPPLEWTEIEVPRSVRLTSLARELDVDADLLAELNAHLVRGRTPPKRGTARVRVPKAAKGRARAAVAVLERESAGESTYTVREGDRLGAIASAHGIAEKQLRRDNGILDAAEVRRGVVLVVPAGGSAVASRPPDEASERPLAAVPRVAPGKHERLVFFTATRASTPTSIAAAFGVPWAKVVGWNDLDPRARVQPGQVLQVVVKREWKATKDVVVHERDEVDLVQRGSKEHLEAALARRGKQRRAVKAKKGDTLAKLGKRFDLTDGDLARINGYARDHALAPGEVVVVYVDDADARGTLEAPPPRVSAGRDDALAAKDAAISGHDDDVRDDDEPARATAGKAASTQPRASKRRERRRSHSASTPSTSRLPGRREAPP